MVTLLWEASALVKAYVPEVGSATVSALLKSIPRSNMAITFIGYAETHAVLVRKRNQGILTLSMFHATVSALELGQSVAG